MPANHTYSWLDYFVGMLDSIRKKSKDPTTQVGAIAVGEDNEVLETGFNGLPRGVEDLPERMVRPEKYLYTAHAEANLVATAARSRLKGSAVYVTHLCCNECAKLLINAGVAEIIMGDEPTSMPPELHQAALTMLEEAGVQISYYSEVGAQNVLIRRG